VAECWGYIGPLGYLVPIKGAQAGLQVSPARQGRQFVPVGGMPRAQVAPHAARSWSITLSPWSPPEIVSVLRMIAAGMIASPAVLYAADAAAVNLLPDEVANAGSPGCPFGTSASSVPMLTRQGLMPVPYWTLGDASAWSREVPVLPSTQYTLSATVRSVTSDATPILELSVRNVAGVVIDTRALVSAATSGSDSVVRSTTFTTGASAASVSIRLAATPGSGGMVAGPRLVEGASDGFMEPGQGVPYVQVDDPQAVLQSTAGGSVRSDYTVTLTEVSPPL